MKNDVTTKHLPTSFMKMKHKENYISNKGKCFFNHNNLIIV